VTHKSQNALVVVARYKGFALRSIAERGVGFEQVELARLVAGGRSSLELAATREHRLDESHVQRVGGNGGRPGNGFCPNSDRV